MRGSSHGLIGGTERKHGRTEENGKKSKSGFSVPDLIGNLLPSSSE
jgi:hypothetical protein